jgi:hypothetical protein
MASVGRRLRTASGGRDSRPPPSDGLGGRPWRPLDGHPFRRSEGGWPLRLPVAAADGWPMASPSAWWMAAKVEVCGVVERGRGRPDA